jgi:hypothetical protein
MILLSIINPYNHLNRVEQRLLVLLQALVPLNIHQQDRQGMIAWHMVNTVLIQDNLLHLAIVIPTVNLVMHHHHHPQIVTRLQQAILATTNNSNKVLFSGRHLCHREQLLLAVR